MLATDPMHDPVCLVIQYLAILTKVGIFTECSYKGSHRLTLTLMLNSISKCLMIGDGLGTRSISTSNVMSL